MSLKAFHLVFIVAAILLCLFVGGWCFMNYASPQGVRGDLAGGLGCVAAVIALVFYERYFLKKFKNVSYL